MNNLQDLSKRYADLSICEETNQIKCYIKFHLLHANEMNSEIKTLNTKKILCTKNINESPDMFFKKLMKYERKHEYNYKGSDGKKKYKTIYGVKLEVLLPRSVHKKKDMIKFVTYFMSSCNPSKFKLPYLAYVVHRGHGTYVIILLSERESIGHIEYLRYDRNYWSKSGELLHKKGDIKLDQNGKKRKEFIQFSKKARIFVIDQSMRKIRKRFTDLMLIALKKIKRIIKYRFVIQKKKANRFWHYFNRRCVEVNNEAINYIEYMLNYCLDLQSDNFKSMEENPYWYKLPKIPKYKELKNLFFKYRARFEKNEFHDIHGQCRKIGYKHVALNELRKNLEILINEFKVELKALIPAAFN